MRLRNTVRSCSRQLITGKTTGAEIELGIFGVAVVKLR